MERMPAPKIWQIGDAVFGLRFVAGRSLVLTDAPFPNRLSRGGAREACGESQRSLVELKVMRESNG